jgi:hypothetical protein
MGTYTYPCVKDFSHVLREPAKFGPVLPSLQKQNHIRRATCVLGGVNNNKKALGIERHQEQQRLGRLRLKAGALASETPLKTEPMSGEHQKQEELDAVALVQELQEVFASRRTRSAEWREEQLKAMARMMKEREGEICEALRLDLNKPAIEAFVSEVMSRIG